MRFRLRKDEKRKLFEEDKREIKIDGCDLNHIEAEIKDAAVGPWTCVMEECFLLPVKVAIAVGNQS